MKSPATDYIHWLGVQMSHPRGELFESFKRRNAEQCRKWRDRWPQIEKLYPIYWETSGQRWIWCPISQKEIVDYVKLCEGVLRWKIQLLGEPNVRKQTDDT